MGGIRLDERAGDLAVTMCIVSALFDAPLPSTTAYIGELSLTGEVRGVSRIEKRVQECYRLGFTNIVLPKTDVKIKADGAKLIRVKNIAEAVRLLAASQNN